MNLEVDGEMSPVRSSSHVFAPHGLCSEILKARPLQRQVSLFGPGGKDSIRVFWERALQTERGKKHPVAAGSGLATMLSVVLHVDGVEVYNKSKYISVSWSSVYTISSVDDWACKFRIASDLSFNHALPGSS